MSRENATIFLGDFFSIAPSENDRTWTVGIAIEPNEVGHFLTEVGTPPRAVKYAASRATAPHVLVIACPRPVGAEPVGQVIVDALARALLGRIDRDPIPVTEPVRRLHARLCVPFGCLPMSAAP